MHQDALGIQGRRVATTKPSAPTHGGRTLLCSCDSRAKAACPAGGGRGSISIPAAATAPCDNTAVLAQCNASNLLQKLRFNASDPGTQRGLYITACNSSDPYQQWEWSSQANHSGRYVRIRVLFLLISLLSPHCSPPCSPPASEKFPIL